MEKDAKTNNKTNNINITNQSYNSINLEGDDVRAMVMSYLVHHCYKNTACAFKDACNMDFSKLPIESMDNRKKVCYLVVSGNIAEAITLTNKLYPELFIKNKAIAFKLHSQLFIEMIRKKQAQEALIFAQSELRRFGQESVSFLEPLQDIIALLAYDNPEASPVGSYLSLAHRENIANNLNNAIIEYHNLSPSVSLEYAIRQLTVVHDKLNEIKKLLNGL